MGFVDPTLIQRKFWRFFLNGKELPDFLVEMIDEVSITETQYEKNDGHIAFVDSPYKLSDIRGVPLRTMADLVSDDGREWFFQAGRQLTAQIGHSADFCESVALNMAAFRPTFPATGEPVFDCYVRDGSYRMQHTRAVNKPFTINKLSELFEKLAGSYGLGIVFEEGADYVYKEPHQVLTGTRTDAQILSVECAEVDRFFKVIGNNIQVARLSQNINDNTDHPRFRLYYRMGDCSILTFTPNERPTGTGMGVATTQATACARILSTGEFILARIDKELYGVNSPDWTGELKQDPRWNQEEITPIPDNHPTLGRSVSENVGVQYSLQNKDSEFNKILTEIGPGFSINQNLPYKDPKLFGFDPENTTWFGKGEDTQKPESDEHQEPGESKDAETAKRRLGSSAVKETYDATLETLMFDPLLRIGTAIQCFGLGHRFDGKYRICGRTMSMSRSAPPKMVLMLKRVALSHPVPIAPAKPTKPVAVAPNGRPTLLDMFTDTCTVENANTAPVPKTSSKLFNFGVENTTWKEKIIKLDKASSELGKVMDEALGPQVDQDTTETDPVDKSAAYPEGKDGTSYSQKDIQDLKQLQQQLNSKLPDSSEE